MVGAARDWLIDGAPGASGSAEVFAGTCARLAAAGVPVVLGETYVRTLHPQFAGRAFVWERGESRMVEADHEDDLVIASPALRRVFETGETARERGAHGLIDVVALPLRFTTGAIHAAAFGTDRAAGFSPADVAAIEAVMPPLSRMAEILALRRTALNILDAYVGREAGARVLAGKIRRGDTDLIEAAIWFSDMRGFSTSSSKKSPRETIAMLNELFDCQLPAIEQHGGEVLKFIGDGILAIFTPRGADRAECCKRAMAASHAALAALAARNAAAVEPVRFGIALHFGEAAYGNIGGETRLDFTCIGHAVNLAARLESLTATTGYPILTSSELAERCGIAMTKVGEFAVKGFSEPIAAYAPA
jgi:adenylate cyclase